MIRRRDVLLAVSVASAIAAASPGPPSIRPAASAAGRRDKRRAQYQPNSPEVQTFYRINRYPVT